MLNSMQTHDPSGQEKNRQNRNPAQTAISGKSNFSRKEKQINF